MRWSFYGLRLGTLGFGGPAALVGYMHRDLVEQLMPGPLAAQLAIYLGYVHYRITGATLVGIAFVLPSFLMVVALGAAYVAPAPRKRYNVQRTGNDVRLMSNASEAFFGKMSPAQSKVDK